MYSKHHHRILGFHGCDRAVADRVLAGKEYLIISKNSYDWLGHGAYFWENDHERALQYAELIKENPKRGNAKIENPAVIGAVIDLGYCLDLVNSTCLDVLKLGYTALKTAAEMVDAPLPENKKSLGEESDLLLRNLDCAVIETIHKARSSEGEPAYDSVRGVFWEGDDLYPNAGFKERNHIQICVRNPNCIKGFFLPRKTDCAFDRP